MSHHRTLAIIGAGNLGMAMAVGLAEAGVLPAASIHLSRRHVEHLGTAESSGFRVGSDNVAAVGFADDIIVAVEPSQIDGVLQEIGPHLDADRHLLISVVSGVSIAKLEARINAGVPVIRAMPNTAIGIRKSMTCLASDGANDVAMARAQELFSAVGRSLVIEEEQMAAATALGACGVAFFLRAVRAASQGGIEIGFSSQDALTIASQTALGAAGLLLENGHHPEQEIDRVTTPRGCTIAGLNRMEHEGFSAAMVTGITTSAARIGKLY